MLKNKVLLVIIPDHLSSLIQKGEITERYYNPGNLFDEVHILLTNNDKPNPLDIQKTVGKAKLFIHNLPATKSLFLLTLGYTPFLLHAWARPAIELAKKIQPLLIRCHGSSINAFAASCIKKKLNIPYLVSLHINPDEDLRGRNIGFILRLYLKLIKRLEKYSLKNADWIMPVYKPIVPYLQRMGLKNHSVFYNALNPLFLRRKENYSLGEKIKIISVGRQFESKNPDHLIEAVAKFKNIEFTLVGNGPYHPYLKTVAQKSGAQDRIIIIPSMANDKLCSSLANYDIFATHTEYWEISKSLLEALLTGLPVVINRRIGLPVPELEGDFILLVENSVEGYYNALKKLIEDNNFREQLGRKAFEHAQENWAPAKTELKFVELYKKYIT